MGNPITRAELMRRALTQALCRVHIGAKRLKIDEETRWQIAGAAIEELRRYGGWQALEEEAPIKYPGAAPLTQLPSVIIQNFNLSAS